MVKLKMLLPLKLSEGLYENINFEKFSQTSAVGRGRETNVYVTNTESKRCHSLL